MRFLTKWVLILAVGALSIGFDGPAAKAEAVYKSFLGSAINGYDPVAYFVDGKPQEGKKAFEVEWKGASWRFKNAANKATFEKDPEKYAPQFGGFCAWAVSQGYTASTVPEAWDIVDGKLYLNYSLSVQSTWRKDRAKNIQSAKGNWPKLRDK